MLVKIGDKFYDSNKEPIMIVMTIKEKKALNENFIQSEAKKYCIYPGNDYWDENNYKRIKKWMEI